MNKEVTGGIIGSIISAVGTGLQTNEILQAISLVLTIVGTLITTIMAIANWWKKAKKDGKITKEEIQDGVSIIVDSADKIKDTLEDKEDKKMKVKEKIESLKGKLQAKITPESSAEEIQEVNDFIAELDSLDSDYNDVVTENAKFKDTIVRMTITQGNGNKPENGADGSKTMSILEAVAEVQNKGGK